MSIYPRYERVSEIDYLLHALTISRPGDYERTRNDPLFHHQRNILRDLLQRADKAMEDEGIDFKTRDRILHRVVFCETPEDTSFRLERGADQNARISFGPIQDLLPETIADLRNHAKPAGTE